MRSPRFTPEVALGGRGKISGALVCLCSVFCFSVRPVRILKGYPLSGSCPDPVKGLRLRSVDVLGAPQAATLGDASGRVEGQGRLVASHLFFGQGESDEIGLIFGRQEYQPSDSFRFLIENLRKTRSGRRVSNLCVSLFFVSFTCLIIVILTMRQTQTTP